MEFTNLDGYQLVHINDRKKGNILREKRIVQNLTQQQVADRAGIKIQQYQKFESNERNIMTASFQLACKVIEALGMNASDFFHGKYVIGEEIFVDTEGVKYKKTGKLISEDVI